MVSTVIPKRKLLQLVDADENTVLDVLPDIKCNVEAHDEKSITLEITGDRPDLLSVWGVARALKGHLGKETGLPQSAYQPSGIKITVDPDAESLRPVLVAAVIEGVDLDDEAIQHLFQVQEKLDLTNGRRRKKSSIGLYDLDKLAPPFFLKNASMSTKFNPLKSDREMTVKEILTSHPTGKEYANLVKGAHHPVLIDSKGQILSLVDIINGVSSAVTESTKRIFIDITGTDLHSCNTTLALLCQDFADAGATVSTVDIHYLNKKLATPDTKPEKFSLRVETANKLLGTALSPKDVVKLLKKQRLDVDVGKTTLEVFVPRYRADFLHEADLLEEIAIAYGFNALEPKEPSVFTIGSKSADTYACEKARDTLAAFGFQEVLTHLFTSPGKAGKAGTVQVVKIRNPVSDDYNALRSSLLPGLLNVLSRNTHRPYPQRVFEVGEAVVKDSQSETGTRTDLHAAFASAHASASLSETASMAAEFSRRLKMPFTLSAHGSDRYIEGRAAKISSGGLAAGELGEIHPAVLERFGILMPVCVFEIRLKKGER